MKVKVKVDIDPNLIENRVPRADNILATQVQKDTEQFVPARTKAMSNWTLVDGGEIIYPGPYAHYLYEGKLRVDPETKSPYARKGVTKELTDRDLIFNKVTHADAQDHWFEASKSLNLDKWLRIYGRAIDDGD